MTTPEQIAEWLAAPEGRQLEFKTASTSFHFEKLIDYCVALANEGGVVESQGRGRGVRYLLSRGLYAALGKKGAYTRKRGLDHDTNKKLLCKHIRENDADGSPLNDLKQVLPALSTAKIQTLLHELRDDGRIRLVGMRRWARWHLASPKGVENK